METIKKKKILHIASYYISSKVYKELFTSISNDRRIEQEIYIPLKDKKHMYVDEIKEKENIKMHYRKIQNKLDRYFYEIKIQKTYADLKKQIQLKEIDFIFAHTIFADGMLAYKLKKEYNIDYVVVVRNSDVNAYLKCLPQAKYYFKKIVSNAKNVIFISPMMKKDVENKINDKEFITKLRKKTKIIPNGIDNFWHTNTPNNVNNVNKKYKQTINLIQVSKLDKNKNLFATIDIAEKLRNFGYNINLTILGSGDYEDKYKKYVSKKNLKEVVKFEGYIKEPKEIKRFYNNNDIFIMLSKTETFGLVYIEAMSQGLPVIFSKGTGIDGYFQKEEVGFGLDPNNPLENLEENMNKILNNYETIAKRNIQLAKSFEWTEVSKKYLGLMK